MTSAYPIPTFRDPDGSLTLYDDHAVRTIQPSAAPSVLRFLHSALYRRMQERGDIVASTIDDSPVGLRLLHPRIPIPTYPWEWTPSQWVAAADLTLTLCDEALTDGFVLKDATPLNILFIGPRPVLVDVLSFDVSDPTTSIWLAYGQYVRTFLLPLLMNRMSNWPLALSLFRRDGYEPTELFSSLSWPQRLSRDAFWPITLPAWLERSKKPSSTPQQPRQTTQDPEAALHILKRTLENLRRRTHRAAPQIATSDWSDYQSTLTHYTPQQSHQKKQWVQEIVETIKPTRALDIGANTGEYSQLLAQSGIEVVALERDAASAERIFRSSQTYSLPIQTLHADFARPTPAVGWNNSESTSLLSRLEARFDLVLMLAVIHHLILLEQIPLPAILSLVHRLTTRHLIIEWVPVTDPMFQDLMRGRDHLYGTLTEDSLLSACTNLFTLQRRLALENGRILLLFEKIR